MKFSKNLDWFLFLPVIFLLGIGTGIIASVSPGNLINHLVYILFATTFFLAFSLLDIKIISPFSIFIYIFSILLLCLPFVFGTVTRGSVRWIPIGSYTLQPSELVKPLFALFCAWYWSQNKFTNKKFINFILFCLPIIGLIFIQPDLGSTLVILSIVLCSVLFSGIKFKQLVVISIIATLLIPSSWFFLKDYQKLRIVHFVNPSSDPLGEGYNVIQSMITVGSGSFFGRGLGKGTQSHLSFLPERHTDFIFASLAEEIGFAGSLLVLLLFLILFLRILKIAKESEDKLSFLLSMNIFVYLVFQAVINISMNIGIMPITGITLPLLSYGGSSLLATMISLGIVVNISKNRRKEHIIEIK